LEITKSLIFQEFSSNTSISRKTRSIDYADFIKKAADNEIKVAVAADILSLVKLTPPGEIGAAVVVGTTQRFGIRWVTVDHTPLILLQREEYKRSMPGRIIGVSQDANGNRALRMALQTREQHIKREKATSNICTAQVLLSVMQECLLYITDQKDCNILPIKYTEWLPL
jgi:glycine cleavage system pyridoxal-binding protein P